VDRPAAWMVVSVPIQRFPTVRTTRFVSGARKGIHLRVALSVHAGQLLFAFRLVATR